MTKKYVKMDDHELKELLRETAEQAASASVEATRAAVKEGLQEGFQALGLDMSDIDKVQRDFKWVRDTRTTGEAMKRRSVMMALAAFVTGASSLLWIGFKSVMAALANGSVPTPPHP